MSENWLGIMFVSRCVVAAIFAWKSASLVEHNKPGWGWMLFAAICVCPDVEFFKP